MTRQKANERVILNTLLKRLKESDAFAPELITESERPDFTVVVDGQTIGIEVTLSATEEYVRALKLQASEYPDRWLNTTHLKDRTPRRRNVQLVKSMGYHALLQPWKRVSDSMLDWRTKIEARLNSKRQKLNQSDFQLFSKNWLIIDDYPPLPSDQHVHALAEQNLSRLFAMQPVYERDFDAIFVQSGDYLWCWIDGELLRANLAT